MIRCGYIRWELHVEDRICEQDRLAREIVFAAKPTYRTLRTTYVNEDDVRQRFAQGNATYQQVLQAGRGELQHCEITLPDVGPRVHRYNRDDRDKAPRYWMDKVGRAMEAFAYEVVATSCNFPQLLIANPVLRANYAYLVTAELQKVAQGRSLPQPTNEVEKPEIDVRTENAPIPELVAAELVRDVVAREHFDEFRVHNRITVQRDDRTYVIPRQTHGLINVLKDGKPECRLCVVFKDPGLPPSDEVVMKYLLVTQQTDMLWQIANRF